MHYGIVLVSFILQSFQHLLVSFAPGNPVPVSVILTLFWPFQPFSGHLAFPWLFCPLLAMSVHSQATSAIFLVISG